MAQSILAEGARNVKTGAIVAPGGGVGSPYGGALAIGNGVADDTQAFLDAMNLNRHMATAGSHSGTTVDPLTIYVPSGTYLLSRVLIMWDLTLLFGEPSARPTLVLKSGSMTSGSTPFFVTCPSTAKPAYTTDWTTRGGVDPVTLGNTTTTNNLFGCWVRDINFTVQSNNAGCSNTVLWATAQNCGFRNSIITATSSQSAALSVDLTGGGGQAIDNIVTNGGTLACNIGDYYAIAFRSCAFNGRVNNNARECTFVTCTFNNPGTVGLANNPFQSSVLDDCAFTANTQYTASGTYHIENTTFATANTSPSISAGLCQQYTTGAVFYNRVSVNGTNNANLLQAGVLRTSPVPTTLYQYPSAACVSVLTLPGIVHNSGVDVGGAINTALATHNELYFPIGDYLINTTINLGPGKKLFGGGANYFVGSNTSGYGAGYGQTNLTGQANPLITVTGNGTAGVVIESMGIVSSGNNTAIVWNGDPSSVIFDCPISPAGSGAASLGMNIQSGGFLWVAGMNSNQSTLAGPIGFQISSHGPVYIIGISTQEYTATTWVLNGAQNLYVSGVDGEAGTLEMSITNSSNIYVAGLAARNTGGSSNVTVTTSQVSLWGLANWDLSNSVPNQVVESAIGYGGVGPLGGFVDFTAPVNSVPSLTVSSATNVTPTTATLNGTITSNGNLTITSDGFDWGTSTSYGNSINSASTVQSGNFSANLTGLSSGTVYHYRAKAVNSQGTGFSPDSQFAFAIESPDQSIVTSASFAIFDSIGGVWVITSGGQVTLNGTIIGYTSGVIEIAYVNHVVWQQNNIGQWYSFTSTGAIGVGPTTSPIITSIPTVVTSSAVPSSTTAILNGIITAAGGQLITANGFDWGTTISYGTHSSSSVVQPGSGSFTSNISGLSTNTLYHYRATADNASGQSVSVDATFTTAGINPAFVQSNTAVSATSTTTVSASYLSAQTAGNCNLICVTYAGNTTVSSVLDTATGGSNSYVVAIPALFDSSYSRTQVVYVAKNIKATVSGNTVTVTLTAAATTKNIQIFEYSGANAVTPIDVFSQTDAFLGDNQLTPTCPSISTTGSNETIVSFLNITTGTPPTVTIPTGFTSRVATNSDYASDGPANNIAPYATKWTLSGARANIVSQLMLKSVPVSPIVNFLAANQITPTTASLNGLLVTNGSSTVTLYGFRWGLTAAYGTTVSLGAPLLNNNPFTAPITGLSPSTTYHFQAFASSPDGNPTSLDTFFVTPPVVTHSPVTGNTGISGETYVLTLSFQDEFDSPLSQYDGSTAGTPKVGTWQTWQYYGSQNTFNGRVQGSSSAIWSDSAYNGVNPFSVSGSNLTITAANNLNQSDPKSDNMPFTSGILNTIPSFSQTYGYFECRCRTTPMGVGIWPAFWLLAADIPTHDARRELDIVEVFAVTNAAAAHAHYLVVTPNIHEVLNFAVADTTAFHIYACLWTPSNFYIYLDDVQVGFMPNPGFVGPEYILLDLATGATGSFLGFPTPDLIPCSFIIDYVRAYSISLTEENFPIAGQVSNAGQAPPRKIFRPFGSKLRF